MITKVSVLIKKFKEKKGVNSQIQGYIYSNYRIPSAKSLVF